MPVSTARPVTFVMTREREAAMAFYGETLGLRLLSEDAFAAVYDLGGVTMRLTSIPDHAPSPHTILGWTVDDIEEEVRALRNRGVAFQVYEGFGQDDLGIWTAPGGGAKVAWFLDPDGNNLSLTEA